MSIPAVGLTVDEEDADNQGKQHLPARQPKKEQAGSKGVAADAVDIRHPHSEDTVRTPGTLVGRNRRKILVVEALAVLSDRGGM